VRPSRAISGMGSWGTTRVPGRRWPARPAGSARGTPTAAVGSSASHGDFVVGVAGLQPGLDPFDLAGSQPVRAGAEGVADPVERVVFAAAVIELFLLDPAAGLLHRLQAELHPWKASKTAVASWSSSRIALP
jgi:hypothetical protein